MARLTRQELLERVLALPGDDRDQAVGLLEAVYVRRGDSTEVAAKRDFLQRRSYAGAPERYFQDVLGIRIVTQQQEDVLHAFEAHDRVLVPSGHNTGKSWLLAAYGCYVYDAKAALPDPDHRYEEQGARVLLPAPTEATARGSLYSEMQAHADNAEARGYPMPGWRLPKSVKWWVRTMWDLRPVSPSKRSGQKIAHAASGWHHGNMVALMEEAAAVAEAVWLAIEGMCSSSGNKILAAFQPSEHGGPAHRRSKLAEWKVIHLSAFDHPNVRGRQVVVPKAIGFGNVDSWVRMQCQELGRYPERQPDPTHNEFVYALPRPGLPERPAPAGLALAEQLRRTAREDGFPGHPDAPLAVWRPSATFEAQVLGRWPSSTDRGLFSEPLLQAAFKRYRGEPDEPADRVGFDVAREGSDDACVTPAWGRGAESLLRSWSEAVEVGDDFTLEQLKANHAIVGAARVLPKGDGPEVAAAAIAAFPLSPFIVDAGSVGASVYDHLTRVLRADAVEVQFGAAPPDPVHGEPWSENMRTAMYVRAAMLVRFGLVDIAEDPLLLEELLAHETVSKQRSVDAHGRKERVESVLLIPKDKIKEKIGRSPDRADAFVLALTEQASARRAPRFVFGS